VTKRTNNKTIFELKDLKTNSASIHRETTYMQAMKLSQFDAFALSMNYEIVSAGLEVIWLG